MKFVPSQNGIVFRIPNELPDAAYKIFAGPGLITIGSSVTSHRIANSISINLFVHEWGHAIHFHMINKDTRKNTLIL